MSSLFIDTEFNGFGGQLISMAIVSDCGKEWYEVLPEPYFWDEWVFDNVFPALNKKPIPAKEWKGSLYEFLRQFDNPLVVADWYTDFVHFFESFQGSDHTQSFVWPCCTRLVLIENYDSAVPHNALSDARAIRDVLARVSLPNPPKITGGE